MPIPELVPRRGGVLQPRTPPWSGRASESSPASEAASCIHYDKELAAPGGGGEHGPERDSSVEIHRGSAELYDASTACFRHYRWWAVELLRLRPGEVVVDVGCGTGLCFPLIEERIGRQGRLIGIERCPEMLSRAASRVEAHRWGNVTLLHEPAEEARLPVACDAALFCATHDILRSPIALKNVLGQLRPGGRAVAIGGKWAPPWMPALNIAVFALHWPWARTFEAFERPWSHMEQLVGDLQVETLAFGAGFVAWGIPRP
ncbi:MAG: methyltransferase domain-containing protein [Acidimicrobiales bacterium]